jgi:hypothetical protein
MKIGDLDIALTAETGLELLIALAYHCATACLDHYLYRLATDE